MTVLGLGETDGNGNISIIFTVPEGEPGQHTVTSTSQCGGTRVSFRVVGSPTVTTTSPPDDNHYDYDYDYDYGAPTDDTAPPTSSPPTTTAPPPTTPGASPLAPGGAVDSYKDSTLAQLEDIAKRELESGVILYNPPEQMQVGVVVRVEVRIAREESDDLDEGLQGKGDPRVEGLLVGTTMRARLEGSAFDITPIGSDIQQLMSKGFREWRWDVIPTESGSHPLFLIVSVLHERYPSPIQEAPPFERRIDVSVNPGYSLSKWLANNWEKPVVTLVGIIGIIEGYRRLRLRRADDRTA
ncbi:MAG: hypothetical protein M3332_14945 [Actinomycetota bacterium]|nr:hypothetical protein [Actinomycetota bacterium]